MGNTMYKCPVCNFKGLGEPAYDSRNVGSDAICPCCGFQFGLDDFGYENKDEIHDIWRKNWIKEGCVWMYSENKKPKNWNPYEQLKGLTENET